MIYVQGSLMALAVILVAGITNPFVLIPICPLVILFLLLRRVFISTARNVKRIEATGGNIVVQIPTHIIFSMIIRRMK